LLHDFLESLEEKEETRITAKAIETFAREKLVASVADIFRGKLELIQYVVYGVLALFFLVPIIFIVVF